MNKCIILVLIFTVLSPSAICQSNKADHIISIENQLKLIQNKIDLLQEKKFDSTLILIRFGMKLSEENSLPYLVAVFQRRLAVHYLRKSLYDSATFYAIKACSYFLQEGKDADLADCKNLNGSILLSIGHDKESMLYFKESEILAKKSHDSVVLFKSLRNQSILYGRMGKYDSMLYSIQNAIKYIDKDKNEELYYEILTLQWYPATNLKRFNYAYKILEEPISYFRKNKLTLSLAKSLELRGVSKMNKKEYEGSRVDLLEAKTLYESMDNKGNIIGLLHILYALDSACGYHIIAANHLKEALSLKDEVASSKNQKAINEMIKKYDLEVEKKKNQIILLDNEFRQAKLRNQNSLYAFLAIIAILISIALSWYLKIYSNRKVLEARLSKLELLKSKLNPHFLFNTLNSIRVLVKIDPEKCRKAINDLSNIMHYMLSSGSQKKVALSEELELVKHYFDLESIRFGDHLKINYVIHTFPKKYSVPSGCLLTLAENSIKHGLKGENKPLTIDIIVAYLASELTIEFANDGILHYKYEKSAGIGISLVETLLKAMYGEKFKFLLVQRTQKVHAIISIQD